MAVPERSLDAQAILDSEEVLDIRSRTYLFGSYMLIVARYKKGQWDISLSRRPRRYLART